MYKSFFVYQVWRLNLESAKLARRAADDVTAATGTVQSVSPSVNQSVSRSVNKSDCI